MVWTFSLTEHVRRDIRFNYFICFHTASAEGENGDNEDSSQRKSRFLWNNDYDELAQDAHAILRVRLREVGGRMDWVALRQVFPAVPRNSVRQRIAGLREIPNNELYMKRLEDQWHRLWKQYRGTEHLPDPKPKSQTDFDLIKHLQFFRKFIDKNALYVLCHSLRTTIDTGLEEGRFPRDIDNFNAPRDGASTSRIVGCYGQIRRHASLGLPLGFEGGRKP
jgi:hypothetical protein